MVTLFPWSGNAWDFTFAVLFSLKNKGELLQKTINLGHRQNIIRSRSTCPRYLHRRTLFDLRPYTRSHNQKTAEDLHVTKTTHGMVAVMESPLEKPRSKPKMKHKGHDDNIAAVTEPAKSFSQRYDGAKAIADFCRSLMWIIWASLLDSLTCQRAYICGSRCLCTSLKTDKLRRQVYVGQKRSPV